MRDRPSTAVPWGDVVTTFYTTGIGDVEVHVPVSRTALRAMRASRRFVPVANLPPVKAAMKSMAGLLASGPDETQRRDGQVRIRGRVEEEEGSAAARMTTSEPYAFTARSALAVTERVAAGEAPAGFRTPAGAFGPDLATGIEGVELADFGP